MKISDLVNLYFDGMNWTFIIHVKFGHSEKDTKFEKIFHLKFDVTQ